MSCSDIVVSVIVPVYRVEKYLRQCIESILGQSFTGFELILVDDGSPDNCPLICDEYAQKDQRIKVIHKKNGGLSETRNIGLLQSAGKYVVFVDSDDYWQCREMLSELTSFVSEAGDEYDFVNFNSVYYYQKINLLKKFPLYPVMATASKDKKIIISSLAKHGIFPVGAWTKFIRRDFLIDKGIFFKKGITAEDIPWFLEILTKCESCKFINEYYYVYRKQSEESISSSFSEKKYENLALSVISAAEDIKNMSDISLRNALLSFVAYEYCILMGIVNHFPRPERRKQLDVLQKYRWLLDYNQNPKVRKVKLMLQFAGSYITRRALSFYIDRCVNKS